MTAARLTQGSLFESVARETPPAPPVQAPVATESPAVKDGPVETGCAGAFAGLTGIESLDDLRKAVQECRRCDLREGCRGVVFGEGDPEAALMLVGEGPGAMEDELGRPFVGPAGKLLDRILEAAGFLRREVYIANIVKCRPPGNRLPTPAEAARCLPNLRAQIRIIAPRILVCLGALSTQILVDSKARITTARGAWYERDGVRIIPTFHPAALLRDPSRKRFVWEDFKKVRAAYDELKSGAQEPRA